MVYCLTSNKPKYKRMITRLLAMANLGFEEVEVNKIQHTSESLAGVPEDIKNIILSRNIDGIQVKTKHIKRDSNNREVGSVYFNLTENESLGTQKYFALAGPILKALLDGSVLVIDELDARLHPQLTNLITRILNSVSYNPHNAQLIFATHDTHILSSNILRSDQIYFIAKNDNGASELYSMLDLELNARSDASFEKDYLKGKYGALQFEEPLDKQLQLFNP